MQIDESALTGESVPAGKSADIVTEKDPVLGDQSNMAFMNTPVTHGGGVMIVTGTGADTAVGKISGMLKSTPTLKTPMTKQLDTLTLWIAGAAGLTIAIMFALGISRGDSTQQIFTTAIALALAAVPMAMPTVLQVILSTGSSKLAQHGAVVKSLDSVETLGSTSAINSDKTGTLTLNQVTVVEVIDATDRFSVTGKGYGLDGEIHHTAGNTNTIEAAILPFLIANDAKLVDGKVVGDPTEGALLVLGSKAKIDHESTIEAFPSLATLPSTPPTNSWRGSARPPTSPEKPSCGCSSKAPDRRSSPGPPRRCQAARPSPGARRRLSVPTSRCSGWEARAFA